MILFVDGVECAPCKTAKTNMLRLSAGLRGLDAGVGYVDCEEGENRQFCNDIGLPPPPHAPQVRAFRGGVKTEDDKGESLYNPNEVEPHLALQLTEKIIRLAQATKIAEGSVSVGKEGEYSKDKKEEDNNSPTPTYEYKPMWNGPKGRQSFQVTGGPMHVPGQLGF